MLRGDAPRWHSQQLLGLCLLAIASRPFLGKAEFRILLLALSLIGCGVVAGFDALAIFAFAGLTSAVSRTKIPLGLRVLLVSLLWLAPIVPKLWLGRPDLAPHGALFSYWAGIPFSALYLLVERQRGLLDEASWLDDAVYMLALPRFVSPFIQAIPASSFLESQKDPPPDVRLALRGAGLVIYGALLFVLMAKLPYIWPKRAGFHPDPRWVHTPRFLHNVVYVYAANAQAIFCAVGLFRLLGFDLSSGFRWPLLATSFAEFYRRWNHYVYDTVRSLFLFPLIARLRTVLPWQVAVLLSGYLAIFLGAFVQSRVLVPLALNVDPMLVFKFAFEPSQLAMQGVFWSLILVPQVLPRRAASPPTPARKMARRFVFVLALAALGYVAHKNGVILL